MHDKLYLWLAINHVVIPHNLGPPHITISSIAYYSMQAPPIQTLMNNIWMILSSKLMTGIANKELYSYVWTPMMMLAIPNKTKVSVKSCLKQIWWISTTSSFWQELAQLPTATCSSLTINICLGSLEFATALRATSILPSGLHIHIHGDHHNLILDFDSWMLFGNIHPHHIILLMQSNAIPAVKQVYQIAGNGCDEENIAGHIVQIEALDHLMDAD